MTTQYTSRDHVLALFELPFNELLFQAATVHRQHFSPTEVQVSALCSVKTGGCAEDCAYCPQSARFKTEVKAEKLMGNEAVIAAAKAAKAAGATRFCMGAAWRNPKPRDMDKVTAMVSEVKALGLETCGTFGMLTEEQAGQLKEAGLDYYNHNLDTSQSYYKEIITTRTYQDRLDTLAHVRAAGMKVCCGGILGMGEGRADRADLLLTLAQMEVPPESVPINMLMGIDGTPLAGKARIDHIEFVRTIAVARILMPASMLRLSAGRENMSDEMQALCFFAGANSIFHGEKLLTAANPGVDSDAALFAKLGLKPMAAPAAATNAEAA